MRTQCLGMEFLWGIEMILSKAQETRSGIKFQVGKHVAGTSRILGRQQEIVVLIKKMMKGHLDGSVG